MTLQPIQVAKFYSDYSMETMHLDAFGMFFF